MGTTAVKLVRLVVFAPEAWVYTLVSAEKQQNQTRFYSRRSFFFILFI